MTKTPNQIPARERVIVALDVPDRNALTTLLDRLDGRPAFYKVGLELFVAEGERAIELVRARATVSGMSCSLRSRNTRPPRARTSSMARSPSATNSSSPTL